MTRIKTQKQIKLKNGLVIPQKTSLLCEPDLENDSICKIILDNGEQYKVKYTSIFKTPSIETIKNYVFNGISSTPIKKRIEPDGIDEHGFPSWCRILGYI